MKEFGCAVRGSPAANSRKQADAHTAPSSTRVASRKALMTPAISAPSPSCPPVELRLTTSMRLPAAVSLPVAASNKAASRESIRPVRCRATWPLRSASSSRTAALASAPSPIAHRTPKIARPNIVCPLLVSVEESDKPHKSFIDVWHTNWVVSETTSPLNYTPLVTRVIRSTSAVKDAPATLAVRAVENELNSWLAPPGPRARGNAFGVYYQINYQPA